ncbi:MAG: UTP--glucose-1-phosphate uridylyltransferase, partial [Pseudomonadota bacterium]|nr:UTP--glucose-1-phosphate uridylyltransferase [Pseudomonadota bacterium]
VDALEAALKARGKLADLKILSADLPAAGQTSFTRQQEPLGLGHAVWCARELVGGEPFALLLPDVLVKSEGKGCLAQMFDVYEKHGGNVIAVEEVPADKTHQYGVVSIAEKNGRVCKVTGMVEKPAKGTAPSNLIIMGRYILQPEIFDILAGQQRGAGGEIQITDAMIALLASQTFHAVQYEGRSFDCGSKIGFLAANIAFALEREELAPALRAEIKRLL